MGSIQILLTKEFLRLKILLTSIYIFLEFYYHFFISDNFGYMGYPQDLHLLKYFVTKLIFIGLLGLSYTIYKKSKFLYSIYLLLIVFFYFPNAIFFSFSNGAIGPYVSNVFFVCIFSLSPYLKFKFPSIKLSKNKRSIVLLSLVFVMLVPIALVFKSSIHLDTLILSNIYETRELFSQKMGGYLSYLYNFEVKTIIPIALIFFMIRKKKFIIILLVLALLYLYVISGNKIVYFTTFILLFFYYLGANYISKTSNFLIITLVLLIATPFIDNLVMGRTFLGGIFVNRFFFIPSLLTQWYFDFFNGHPFYFAESHFFNQFVKSPYDMPVGFLLTKIHWNEPTVFANNGIVSDGFMNLGYLGVLLFSVIFTFMFSLFNSFKLNKGYFGLFFSYIYIMLSAPLLTCFITGGILTFILIAFFLLRENTLKDEIA